jgi:hypothetical protein
MGFRGTATAVAALLYGSSAQLAYADDLSVAEQAVLDAQARLAQAQAEVARLRRIGELKRELAQLEAGSTAARLAPAPLVAVSQPAAPPIPDPDPILQQKAVPEQQKPQPVVNDAAAAEAPKDEQAKTPEQKLKEDEATRKFGGLELGAGLSFTLDVGDRDRATEAELVNNIVRIKNADNVRARLMFETHYFFKPKRSFLGLEEDMWGVGPFVAIQPGSDEIIEAIGFGLMLGFRRAKDEPQSFNIGVGMVFDPNTQVLGDGILANQPLPAGETEIRYKEDSQTGIMAIASFTF